MSGFKWYDTIYRVLSKTIEKTHTNVRKYSSSWLHKAHAYFLAFSQNTKDNANEPYHVILLNFNNSKNTRKYVCIQLES